MPETFLKAWIATHEKKRDNQTEIPEEKIRQYIPGLKWDMIKNKLVDTLQITIEQEEVKNRAKTLITQQYGTETLGDQLDAVVEKYLSSENGQQFKMLYDQIKTEKILAIVKEKVTLLERVMTLKEFRETVKKKTSLTSANL